MGEYQRLYGPAQLSSSATDLYTAPTGTRVRVRHIHLSNPSGSPVDVTLSVGADGAATRLLDGWPLAADSIYSTRKRADYTLESGEKIQGFAVPSAYPVTALLDDFNRADESPLAGNWSTPINVSGASAAISGNGVITNSTPPAGVSAYWDLAQFGPDCEAWITVSADLDTNENFSVFARLKDVGTDNYDGYQVGINAASNEIGIGRRDNGSYTNLGSVTVTPSVGDSVGIRCVGSRIEAWHKPVGGSWTLKVAATDTTYAAAGYVGFDMYTEDFTTKLDDFGGGTLPTTTVAVIDGYVEAL